jgi:hypothetical protein
VALPAAGGLLMREPMARGQCLITRTSHFCDMGGVEYIDAAACGAAR